MNSNPRANFSWASNYSAPPKKEVPEAVQGNPKRCHIDDCYAIYGTHRCRWQNSVCRRKGDGGGRKFYCDAHRYETYTRQTRSNSTELSGKTTIVWTSCGDCKDDLDADIKANSRVWTVIALGSVGVFIAIVITAVTVGASLA